ncbi:MAG: conjugal transfer protein TraR [Firmicutes bacterium]|nr:conjugal transfer protein TraR [Bacillota bacterium]
MEKPVSYYQDRLLSEKAELESRIHLINDTGLGEPMSSSVEELSSYDNHPADLGTEMFERSKDLSLRENAKLRLTEVNEALHRIDTGGYGTCQRCGQAIPEERLEARPASTTCVECKARDDRNLGGSSRPIEEEVMKRLPLKADQWDDDKVGFDREDSWQSVAQFGTSSDTPMTMNAQEIVRMDKWEEEGGTVDIIDDIPTERGKDGMIYEDFTPGD